MEIPKFLQAKIKIDPKLTIGVCWILFNLGFIFVTNFIRGWKESSKSGNTRHTG
jgi:hypothetical protein